MTELREAVRSLLLPIDPSCEVDAVAAAQAALTAARIEPVDQAVFVRLGLEEWREGQPLDEQLHGMIKATLRAGDERWGERLARSYVTLHDDVLRGKHLLAFDEARTALSHARLICQLASSELMSAAQIARVLAARDSRVELGWRAVRDVLGHLGLQRTLEVARVQALFEADAVEEQQAFADAGFLDAAALVGQAGLELGFPDDLETLLVELFDPDRTEQWHGPYLQILHYVCGIAEFYDHALTYVYEFAPRGAGALWVFGQYPNDLRAGNPVLNNAKAVDRIDEGWARSKEGRLLGPATALAEIIVGLEQMGFAARQELAAWIRRWALRIIRLTRPMAITIPEESSAAQVQSVMRAIRAPTRTMGILEQRFVDAVALSRHAESDGWRAHGLGDSVNASNVSRCKIGDCEFANASLPRVEAYEAHGGDLSEIYLEGHIQTLRRVVPLRRAEWERVASLGSWEIRVVFVAHSFSCEPRELDIAGARVSIGFETFDELVASVEDADVLVPLFTEHVNQQLSEARTPERVRERYLEICA